MAEISQVKLPTGQIYDIVDSGAARIGDITTIQSNLSTAQSNISTLQSGLSTAQSNISTLQSNMSTAQANIKSLQDNVPYWYISKTDSGGSTSQVTAQGQNVVITTANASNQKQYFTFSTSAITLWTLKVVAVSDSYGGGIAFMKQ